MYKKISLIFLLTFTVACANTEDNSQNKEELNTQPIHFETEHEQKDRLNIRDKSIGERGGYPQSDQEGVNASDNKDGYSDPFTNEESERISKALKKKKDIIQAQVASTEERIIIGVMLSEHPDQNISESIKSEVEKILPGTNKEIIVYTDDVHWDRMKNLDARRGAGNTGNDLDKYIDEFFNEDN